MFKRLTEYNFFHRKKTKEAGQMRTVLARKIKSAGQQNFHWMN